MQDCFICFLIIQVSTYESRYISYIHFQCRKEKPLCEWREFTAYRSLRKSWESHVGQLSLEL